MNIEISNKQHNRLEQLRQEWICETHSEVLERVLYYAEAYDRVVKVISDHNKYSHTIPSIKALKEAIERNYKKKQEVSR